MRHVFENRDEAKRKGDLAAQHVRERYTWDRTVELMVHRLKRWRAG